jgi:hypothetical protein
MRNLARAMATAGIAVTVGVVTVPSASAAVHGAGTAEAAKSASSSATSAKSASKPAQKSAAQSKALQKALATRPVTVNVYYVMHDGRVISEQGPGDSAAHEVESNTGAIDMQTQNEPITTGDLEANVDGKQSNSPVTFEVEGSEQDTGEVS